ncbi:MAG: restriction endonuclease [Burkholderiaceae bacterium]
MSAKPNHRSEPTLKERVAAVPWWAWVGAALVSHVLLRLTAAPEATPMLQYLVPALFIVVAAVGLRLRRGSGPAPERNAAGIDLDAMRWRDFEALIGRAFELQGYHMNEPGAAGSDASIDLLMRKERQTYLVHCKTWRAEKVGIDTVQAVQAAMKTRGAVGGFILTSGRFSRDAAAAAGGFNIRAVDGPALQAMLVLGRSHAARAEHPPVAAAAAVAEPSAAPLVKAAPAVAPPAARAAPADTPAALSLPCPVCGADMKKRLAKRGVNAGQYFWGCVRHPECKGTRRVRPE